MATRFFRAGVGTVIYKENGEIAIFKREKPPTGIWQLQQGGIDLDEDIDTTLWRELLEETGLVKDNFETVQLYPRWTIYEDLDSMTHPEVSRIGQAHRWYFLKLKADCNINLANATDKEFGDFRWTTFAEAISQTKAHKKPVYEELFIYFSTHIKH